jgi:hypothetical protein
MRVISRMTGWRLQSANVTKKFSLNTGHPFSLLEFIPIFWSIVD